MKRNSRIISTLALLLMSLSAVSSADAALKARSATIDPATGYPTWYQDTNNLALTNCLDQNGFCLAAFTGAALPAAKADISAANFPAESFFYLADTGPAVSPGGVISVIIWEAAVEAGFASAVVDGGQALFTRIRYRVNVTVPGTYVVTHPYGEETYVIAAGDIGPAPEINFTNDIPGLVPQDFDTAVNVTAASVGFGPPFVGPTFLTNAAGTFITDPVSGNRYIGQPGAPVAVTGSPTGNNFVRIVGGGDTFLSSTFGLQGKVLGLDVAPASNVDLGPVLMLSTTLPKTVTVTNTTGNPITFGALAPAQTAGTDFADFAISPPLAPAVDCFNATLTAATPGNTCSFNVTFTPTTAAKGVRTATVLLAPTTVQPVPAVVPPLSDPPPVTMNLSGTALVTVTTTAGANGTITPVLAAGLPAGTAPAGTAVTFTVKPSNSKFKVRDVLDGTTPVTGPSFTLNTGAVNHTVTASFMPSGNLTGSGTPGVADAVKALRIALGLVTPTDEDKLAMDVAPLGADGRPAGDQLQDLSDVLLILRRAVGVVTW
jgi:hypothetical protein